MLKKEFINWKRNYKRTIAEILLPVVIFLILSIIRKSIQPSVQPGSDISRYSSIVMPVPDPVKIGLATPENSRNYTAQALISNHLEMS